MNIKLTRALAIFDLETTGVNVSSDRIVQIAILKVYPDATEEKYMSLINPQVPIPAEASEIHGIYDKDVADQPTFAEVAGDITLFLENCDLAGFNSNRFDIPLLMEEFLRNDLYFEMHGRELIDVQNIFHKMEKRTLKAAYKYYTGNILEGAHDAMNDVEATFEVLKAQITKYVGASYNSEEEDQPTLLENDVNSLAEFSTFNRFVDYAGRIVYNDENVEVFNFGKHKGLTVKEVLAKDPSYFSWIMRGDFPLYTKKILKEIRSKLTL